MKISTAALAAVMLLGSAACQAEGVSGAALPHFDGLNEDGSFDSSVFYRNDLTVFGGDSGVIYVPEERDPVYGGYFYQYTSGNGGVYTTWWEGEDTSYAFSCLRSKDLNDWELCGAVEGGFSTLLEKEDWTENFYWAPEVIYDPVSEKYVIYFSAMMVYNDGTDPELKTSSASKTSDRFILGMAQSDTPVGPFRMLTSEDFYGYEGATNLNGEEITIKNPPFSITNYFGLDFDWSTIDPSPFIDDDGQMYLFFCP